MWVGVDAGGTFTDIVGYDPNTHALYVLKQPSTPTAPADAILAGIQQLLRVAGQASDAVQRVHHGTTIATNALLQARFARTAMLTTSGFRDVLDIGRQRRPHLFDLSVAKPNTIASRDSRLEVVERMDERGNVVTPLDEPAVSAAVQKLKRGGHEAVAVCLLHAYANPLHEQKVRTLIEQHWPEAMVCISSDVLSEMREYERFATTVVNAGLLPLMGQYLDALSAGLSECGVRCDAIIMQSNGGTVSTRYAATHPVTTFVSGPAAGVIAATHLGARTETPNLLTFDMGGTSTDVCTVSQGVAAMQNERTMAGLPLRVRALGIHTVGAGGGSLGWIDAGGLLKVGPDSAGAEPGPAAYGRGGTVATVTDANIVLGRLGADDLLAGLLRPSLELATDALAALGEPLGLSATETAIGMLQIAHINMVGALRVVSVERGYDPRDFALMAFGGAGPLHAVELAAQLGIDRIIVPPRPGLGSAMGLLLADARADFSLTVAVESQAEGASLRLSQGMQDLLARAREWLRAEGLDEVDAINEGLFDMRYVGQSFELGIPIAENDTLSVPALEQAFHEAHAQLNGYASHDHATEVVTIRLAVRVPNREAGRLLDSVGLEHSHAQGREPRRPHETSRSRAVWFEGYGSAQTAVVQRDALLSGEILIGPAVITQMDATTLLPPEHTACVDQLGNLVVARA